MPNTVTDDEPIEDVLAGIGFIRQRCDLDLLVFFRRHPRALLTSERLASFLGYEIKQVTASLERAIEAGIVTRKQNPASVARLYAFGPADGDALGTLLRFASSRRGRLAILRSLESHSGPTSGGKP